MRVEFRLALEDGSGELAFEWDSEKALTNAHKHGISFEEAAAIFEGETLTAEDNREYGELRERSFGRLESQIGSAVIVCVVHTDRESYVRIISARMASRKERRHFDDYFKKTHH